MRSGGVESPIVRLSESAPQGSSVRPVRKATERSLNVASESVSRRRASRAVEKTQKLSSDPNNVLGSPRSAAPVAEPLRIVVAAYETIVDLRVRLDAQAAALRDDLPGVETTSIGAILTILRRQERTIVASLRRTVEAHRAWPWVSGVRGVSHVLAARLLARLDISKAPTPAAFWMFCGLATVKARTLLCPVCDAKVEVAEGRGAPRVHRTPRGVWCVTPLVTASSGGEENGPRPPRVAMPRPVRGERWRYNPSAKVVCYLIGLSFVRRGGEYRDIYDARRARVDWVHPDWPAGRRYLYAQRVSVKHFLADLWVAWRRAERDASLR